jgi:hypothetical protein
MGIKPRSFCQCSTTELHLNPIFKFFFFQMLRSLYLIYFLLLCWVGYIVAFRKTLIMYQMFCSWIHPLHHSPPSSSSPIPRTVSTSITFPFTYMCTQYLHHIHPPSPFPHLLPLSHWYKPSRQDLLWPPVLKFCIRKEKEVKLTFWLFDSYTRSFLMAFPCLYVL